MNDSSTTLVFRIWGALFCVCLATNLSAAAEPAGQRGLVQDQVDWPSFLARHDLVWDRLGRN
jgi:hypothetical protein